MYVSGRNEEMNVELSIIVPVYNVAQHLPQCLQSILEQELESYEVLLINDGSYDNSAGICLEWCAMHNEFHLISHDRNRGLSEARNTGIREATGKYITFVDSDDYLAPGTLEACLRDIGEADVIEYPIMIDHLSAHPHLWEPAKESMPFDEWMQTDGFTHCFACNKMFSTSLWDGHTFPAGRYYEDIFTIPYILQEAGTIAGTMDGTYYYCNRKGSISTTPKLSALRDYTEALVQLLSLPVNACNTALYIRSLNAQRSYLEYGGKERIVPPQCIPWAFLFSTGLTFRQRMKALWFKLTYR